MAGFSALVYTRYGDQKTGCGLGSLSIASAGAPAQKSLGWFHSHPSTGPGSGSKRTRGNPWMKTTYRPRKCKDYGANGIDVQNVSPELCLDDRDELQRHKEKRGLTGTLLARIRTGGTGGYQARLSHLRSPVNLSGITIREPKGATAPRSQEKTFRQTSPSILPSRGIQAGPA